MTLQTPPPGDGDRILDEPLTEALSRRYLAYALSTISSRALPDVRDGLKPVHRRLMYAMSNMRLNPEAAARKCAKVVGEVMGNFHPHGDQSIYDALPRTFPSATCSSRGRGTSAISTAITPPPCATPNAR
jgi:topoisomerase-4 subunit A